MLQLSRYTAQLGACDRPLRLNGFIHLNRTRQTFKLSARGCFESYFRLVSEVTRHKIMACSSRPGALLRIEAALLSNGGRRMQLGCRPQCTASKWSATRGGLRRLITSDTQESRAAQAKLHKSIAANLLHPITSSVYTVLPLLSHAQPYSSRSRLLMPGDGLSERRSVSLQHPGPGNSIMRPARNHSKLDFCSNVRQVGCCLDALAHSGQLDPSDPLTSPPLPPCTWYRPEPFWRAR